MEIVQLVIQNPFVSLFIVTVCVFLAVAAARLLGVTRIGPIMLAPSRIDVVSELIRQMVGLEVEKQSAPSNVKSECRRIVKDSVEQIKAVLKAMYGGQDVRSLDNLLAGPVNTYLVGEVMAIVERNHITELDREAWNARKYEEFRSKMLGLGQILIDSWPLDFDVGTDVRKKLNEETADLFFVWDKMLERVHSIALSYAERIAEIDSRINEMTAYYRKHGKLLKKT